MEAWALQAAKNPRRRVARPSLRTVALYGTSPYTHCLATSPRSRRIEIRVTEEEHSVENAAAATLGVSLSEFYRQAASQRAAEVLAERSRVTLDAEAAARFLEALDHPERFAQRVHWLAEGASQLSE